MPHRFERIVSADDGQFAIPAARLGLGYGFDGIAKLTHIVGPTMAAEIMLTARRFTAAEAQQMGLINRVVPADELLATVTELAAMIADNAPLTVKAAKASVKETFKDPARRDVSGVAAMVEVETPFVELGEPWPADDAILERGLEHLQTLS